MNAFCCQDKGKRLGVYHCTCGLCGIAPHRWWYSVYRGWLAASCLLPYATRWREMIRQPARSCTPRLLLNLNGGVFWWTLPLRLAACCCLIYLQHHVGHRREVSMDTLESWGSVCGTIFVMHETATYHILHHPCCRGFSGSSTITPQSQCGRLWQLGLPKCWPLLSTSAIGQDSQLCKGLLAVCWGALRAACTGHVRASVYQALHGR